MRGVMRFWAALLLAVLLGGTMPSAAAGPAYETAALLEDIDCLRQTLEAEYPFLPLLAERGVDFDALCDAARRRTEACGGSLERFYDGLAAMFAGMDRFAHLDVVTPELYRFYADNLEQLPEPLRGMIGDGDTRNAYAALDAARSREAPVAPEVRVDWYPEERALALRMTSFDGGLIDRDRSAVAEALAAHPDARHIVFDITGNRGGADDYWSSVVVAPFGGEYSHVLTDFARDTALCRAYLGAANLRPLAEYPGEIPGFAARLGLTHFVSETETLPLKPCAGPTVETAAKRWVLIDGGAYSAADGFARFCKDTGWATLVGEPTGGCGAKGGAPFIVRLPNTGLLVRFDAVAAANADGTLNAETGTKPDIPCKPGETPMRACLRAIHTEH